MYSDLKLAEKHVAFQMDVAAEVVMKLGEAAVKGAPCIASPFGRRCVVGQRQNFGEHRALVVVRGPQSCHQRLYFGSVACDQEWKQRALFHVHMAQYMLLGLLQ